FRADAGRLEEGQTHQLMEVSALPKNLRGWLAPAPAPASTPAPAPVPTPTPTQAPTPTRDPLLPQTWEKALAYFLLKHAHIELQGIRRTDGAVRLPLEHVYVELRADRAGATHRPAHADPLPNAQSEHIEEMDRTLTLHEALAQSPRAIFVGDPGSGKTTLLRYVTRILAEGALRGGDAARRARELLKLNDDQPVPFPIFTTLADLDRWLEERELKLHQLTGKLSQGFLCSVLESAGLPLTVPELQVVIDAGRLIVLLDGFDEIPGHRERQRAAKAVSELLACCPKLRVLMTSRTRAFETDVQSVLSQLEPWRLQPMSAEELLRFLRVWYGAVHAPDTALGEKVAHELHVEIQQHPEVRQMATTPNILTLIAILKHNQARLPKRRVELYREVIDLFLELKDIAKGLDDVWEAELGIRFDLSEKRQLLSTLALEMHGGGEAGRTVP
ncbi:MAG: NACHT domain-containing protein, partial [Myxococcota bacterium]